MKFNIHGPIKVYSPEQRYAYKIKKAKQAKYNRVCDRLMYAAQGYPCESQQYKILFAKRDKIRADIAQMWSSN